MLLILLAVAQYAAQPGETRIVDVGSQAKPPPERIETLLVYGKDPCPKSSDDEIVVCARQPENERYRIPKKLRQPAYKEARDGSWAGTARVLEYVSRDGRPNSCSPVGSFGQTGCFQKFLEDNRRSR